LTKKILYLWACDYSDNTGEGKLAKIYINFLKKKNNYKIKVCVPKKSLNYKYLSPIVGILYCWKNFLENKETGYVNYLPLWNFFLFILLPPKTILGPITGGANFSNQKNLNYLIRKFIFPLLYNLSQYFLFFRSKEIIFSTDLLKKYLSKKIKIKSKFDFVIKNVNFEKNFLKMKNKDIDFLFYYRKHRNKKNFFPYRLIESLVHDGFQVSIVGDTLNVKNVKNYGFITNKAVNKLQARTRFTITTGENIYSIFTIECLSHGVKILIDSKFNKQIRFFRKMFILIDFNKKNKFLNSKKYNRSIII
tara:strand:- start:4177 stop:5091 length:915 start_codon:yes stop_codon:yes gene_type:complete